MEQSLRPIFWDYVNIGRDIITNGQMVHNKRTQQNCLTVINRTMTYDVKNNVVPADTTRKTFWEAAIAELLGHMRGYDNAEDYAALGARTWFKDANQSAQWVESIYRKGENDCGRIYGGIANAIPVLCPDETGNLKQKGEINVLRKIYNDLRNGEDDRGEIWNFWSPGMFHLGCIRPCMYSHHFSLLGDDLYLTSTQRSADWSLGMAFNSVQCFVLLMLMAQITNKNPMYVKHDIVNAHIYEPHLEEFTKQMEIDPLPAPTMRINPNIKTLEDVLTWVTPDDFFLDDYEHGESRRYEMFTGA